MSCTCQWVATEEELRRRPNGVELLKPDPKAADGFRAPRPGEFYRNPLLATTFRLLAEQGKPGFYDGLVAEAIVEVTRSLGGRLTLEDLRKHGERGSEFTEAVGIRLDKDMMAQGDQSDGRHIHLWEHPPNGQGIIAQMALGVLQELDRRGQIPKFQPEDHNSPQSVPICS
jgi:gamma-glutamyltranspeptidase/glutathione hydrolase